MNVQASADSTVYDLLEPVVATLPVELLDVELNGGTLRVTVDAEGGISSDRLAEVNRLISPILDQHDPIPGRYTLEVSSPGLERPLKTVSHYERAMGEDVVVKTMPGTEPRRIKGELQAIDGDAITIEATEIDGVELDEPRTERVELATVSKARTIFDWGPAPKPGGPKPKAKKASKRGAR